MIGSTTHPRAGIRTAPTKNWPSRSSRKRLRFSMRKNPEPSPLVALPLDSAPDHERFRRCREGGWQRPRSIHDSARKLLAL